VAILFTNRSFFSFSIFASFCAVVLNFGMVSCTTPSFHFKQQAEELGFYEKEYHGTVFFHKVYANRNPLGEFLHVYLGSDGTPWKYPHQMASDPTPRNPVMLRLMALDSVASIYVGRPCYHGFAYSSGCHPRWWTSGRYSDPVVESLSSVLTQIAEEYGTNKIVIFGYSGGGTLAMLLAERLPFVQGIVTVAGNLDIEAWADYHSYSRLTESINPASRPPLKEEIFQFHVIGSQDEVIPPHLVQSVLKRQGGKKPVVVDGVDHQCCWEALWPGLLRHIKQALKKKSE
jgi:hypothetical protein